MDDEDTSVTPLLEVEAMIIEALVSLDAQGNNPDVTASMYAVRKAFEAGRRGERLTGFEILQQARWQVSLEKESDGGV